MVTFMLMFFLRGPLVFALALAAARLLGRASASLRFAVLLAALAAVLVLPVLAALVPPWHTGALAAATANVVASPAMPVAEVGPAAMVAHATPAAQVTAAAAVPWRALLVGLWLAGMVL